MLWGTTVHSEILHDTYLLDVYAVSDRSDLANGLRSGWYELSGGNALRFRTILVFSIPNASLGDLGLRSSNIKSHLKVAFSI